MGVISTGGILAYALYFSAKYGSEWRDLWYNSDRRSKPKPSLRIMGAESPVWRQKPEVGRGKRKDFYMRLRRRQKVSAVSGSCIIGVGPAV